MQSKFITKVTEAVKPYCVWVEFLGTYVQVLFREPFEYILQCLFVPGDCVGEYEYIAYIYPYFNADPVTKYISHEPLP